MTATRCRGTFWETGKLYEKGQEGGALSVDEYKSAVKRIVELRALIGSLTEQADAGDVKSTISREISTVITIPVRVEC